MHESNDQVEARVKERTAELARANAALILSERRFEALVEHGADSIAVINDTNKILYMSPAVATVEGYAPEELIGRHGTDTTHPDDVHLVMEVGRQLNANPGKPIPLLWRRQHKDGRWLWLEGVATNLLHDPAVGGIVTNYRDVTERKRVEAAQRDSEARYRTLFECAPDGIIISDSAHIYADANVSMCRMLGYTHHELVGMNATQIVAAEELQHLDSTYSAVMAGKDVHRLWQLRRKDGSTFPADVVSTKMPDGRPMTMVRDITEQARAAKAIRSSEEYFRFLNDLVEATRTLVDPAQIMVVMARMLGEQLRASRCAYADVEKDGNDFTILHDYTDGCASTVGNYQLSLSGPRVRDTLQRGETLIIRDLDAELAPDEGADVFNALGIKATITCPLIKDGVLRAMMAVHQTTPRDWRAEEITMVEDVVERCWSTLQRRTAEDKLLQLNIELEQRVIERTAQLEATNRELEAFSYSVSHDLRAPLRAVDGYSQAAIDDFGPMLPEEGQRLLRTIRASAQQMGALIDDLLTFARLSRRGLKTQAVDTLKLVREVLDERDFQRPERQIDVRVEELPQCLGDRALLKQVWVNLLSNAFKYTSKREHAVVEIGSTRTNGVDAFFVRDNGVGFDMSYADKLFGVFQRLHAVEDFEGTGVGLAIVQRIVHSHGGRVWADAAVGRGATFYFTLEGETAS